MPLMHCFNCHHEYESIGNPPRNCDWCSSAGYILKEKTDLELFAENSEELLEILRKEFGHDIDIDTKDLRIRDTSIDNINLTSFITPLSLIQEAHFIFYSDGNNTRTLKIYKPILEKSIIEFLILDVAKLINYPPTDNHDIICNK